MMSMVNEIQSIVQEIGGKTREKKGIWTLVAPIAERRVFLSKKTLTYRVRWAVDEAAKKLHFSEALMESSFGVGSGDMDFGPGAGFKKESYRASSGGRQGTIEEDSRLFGKQYRYRFDYANVRRRFEQAAEAAGYAFVYHVKLPKLSLKETAENSDTPDIVKAGLDEAPKPSGSSVATGRISAFGVATAAAIIAVAIFFIGAGLSVWSASSLLLWAAFLVYAKKFAFQRRFSWFGFLSIFILVVVLYLGCIGLSGDDSEKATTSGLHIEQIRFAKPRPDGELEPVDDAVFKRGDEVHLVLLRVSGFSSGEDGLSWYDLDARLIGPDGQIQVEGNDLLGQGGRRRLQGGVAKAPEATFRTTMASPQGKYTVVLTIHDKISGVSEKIERSFVLN